MGSWTWTLYALATYMKVREKQGLDSHHFAFVDFAKWCEDNGILLAMGGRTTEDDWWD